MPPIPPLDALNPVHEHFAVLRALWFGTLFDYANHLFLMLALLEVGLGALDHIHLQTDVVDLS